MIRVAPFILAGLFAATVPSALMLLDTMPPVPASGGSPPVEGSSLPRGHVVIEGFENVATVDGGQVALGAVAPLPNVTAVPEPASWAMMVAGFAGVGAAIRRRVAKVGSLPREIVLGEQ